MVNRHKTMRKTKNISGPKLGKKGMKTLSKTHLQLKKSRLSLKTRKIRRSSLTTPSISQFDVQGRVKVYKIYKIYKKRDYVYSLLYYIEV